MSHLPRRPEPELMDLEHEALAYAAADFRDVNTRFVDRLLELVDAIETRPGVSPVRGLDLGCGPGDIPVAVALRRPRWSIVAVDAADAMLRIARRRAGGVRNVRFVRDDAKTLTSLDGPFDVIFSNSLLHHLPDPMPFWRQVKRLLRPGGVCFLRDLARPAYEQRAAEIVREHAGNESPLLREEFHRSLLSAFTVDEVRQQLQAAGLASLRVERSSDRHLDAWGIAEPPT